MSIDKCAESLLRVRYLKAFPFCSRRTQFTKPKIPEYSTPWLTKSTCLLSDSDCWSADFSVSIQEKSLPVQFTTIGVDTLTFCGQT